MSAKVRMGAADLRPVGPCEGGLHTLCGGACACHCHQASDGEGCEAALARLARQAIPILERDAANIFGRMKAALELAGKLRRELDEINASLSAVRHLASDEKMPF